MSNFIARKPPSTAMPERKIEMKNDPFGNLMDWGSALDTLAGLSNNGNLCRCQCGLIRILRYKGNWRLREEVLKRVGEIQAPSKELVHQVIAILEDDNIYYDARIIAIDALVQLLKSEDVGNGDGMHGKALKAVEKLKSTPQPPFFEKAVDRLGSELAVSGHTGI